MATQTGNPKLSFVAGEIPVSRSVGDWGFNLVDKIAYFVDDSNDIHSWNLTPDSEKVLYGPIFEKFFNISGPAGVTKQKLKRLATQAAIFNPLDATVATGVTMTVNTGVDAYYTQSYYPPTFGNSFAVHGGTPVVYNSNFWVFPVGSVKPATNGNIGGYFPDTHPDWQAAGWEVEFWTDDPKPAIRALGYQGSNSNFRVIVDGRYVTKSPTTYAQNGINYVKLDFNGVRKPRRIQFRCMVGNAFGGVLVGPLSTVWKPDQQDTIQVAFSGDSYTDGMGIVGQTILPDSNWCHNCAALLGWRDVRQVALASTGYLNAGVGRRPIPQQIPTWATNSDGIQVNPDVIVFAGGYNDPIDNPSTLTAAALNSFQLARSYFPNALIFVLGPWPGSGGQITPTLQKEQALYFAHAQFADANSWFVPQESIPVPWISGTGYVGHTNGSGNSDIYISDDGIHPSEAGHIHLGYRSSAAIRDIISNMS